MTHPETCLKCGAILDGAMTCQKCNYKLNLEAYGYQLVHAKTGRGIVLITVDGTPVLPLASPSVKNAPAVMERTGAPCSIVECALAAIANSERHVEVAEEDEEEEIVVVPRASVVGPDFLAEEVWDGRRAPRYCVHGFNSTKFDYLDEISLGETDGKGRPIVYRPVYNSHLTEGVVTLPTEPTPCTFDQAVETVLKFTGNTRYFDPVDQGELFDLMGFMTMGSWFLDRMTPKTPIPVGGMGRFAPILIFRGGSGRGKNRGMGVLRFVSYHPYFDLSKTAVPSLFRPLDLWRGTLLMDEADFARSDADSDLIHFLNARAQGTPITRQHPTDAARFDTFYSFGLTILGQRRHFRDDATENRAVPFYAEKTDLRIPTVEPDDMVVEGLKIQNMLLYLRLAYWDKFEIDKEFWLDEITDPRLMAALLPVIEMSKFAPTVMNLVTSTAKAVEAVKVRQKAASEDGVITNFLWDKVSEGLYATHNGVWYVVDHVESHEKDEVVYALTTSLIAENLKWKPHTVRRIINSLSFGPRGAPDQIRLNAKICRPIWFAPEKFEKTLRDLVVDYVPFTLYDKIGLKRPDPVPVVPVVPSLDTGAIAGDVVKPSDSQHAQEERRSPELVQLVQPVQISRIDKLLGEIRENLEVGELWPRNWLEQHGIPRAEAENVIVGLRDSGKLKRTKGGWTA